MKSTVMGRPTSAYRHTPSLQHQQNASGLFIAATSINQRKTSQSPQLIKLGRRGSRNNPSPRLIPRSSSFKSSSMIYGSNTNTVQQLHSVASSTRSNNVLMETSSYSSNTVIAAASNTLADGLYFRRNSGVSSAERTPVNNNTNNNHQSSNNPAHSNSSLVPPKKVASVLGNQVSQNIPLGNENIIASSVSPTASAQSPDEVIIHVYDDVNKISKDFSCKRDVLLREMKYFSSYLTDTCSFDDIDISVHCDINIFQWLVDYIHKPEETPRMETSWAISILISSDFLQMERLVNNTLKFVHEKLQCIIKLPIELDCINNHLLGRLASLFTDEELDNLCDKKDKIVNKLFMKKFEEMFEKEENTMYRCALCEKLFCKTHMGWMTCTKAKLYIDYHGKVHARHVIDTTWNVNKYIVYLKQTLTWREVYWKFWGLTHALTCIKCNEKFAVSELGHCSYHLEEALFETGSNVGTYPCCNMQALRFDSTAAKKTGCRAKNHIIDTDPSKNGERNKQVLDLATRKAELILIPFEDRSKLKTNWENDKNLDDLFSEMDGNQSSSESQLQDEDEDGASDCYSCCSSDGEGNPTSRNLFTLSKKYEQFHRFSQRHLHDHEYISSPHHKDYKNSKKKKKGESSSHHSTSSEQQQPFSGNPSSNLGSSSSSSQNGTNSHVASSTETSSPKTSKKRTFIVDQQRTNDRKHMDDILKILANSRKDKEKKPMPEEKKKSKRKGSVPKLSTSKYPLSILPTRKR